MSALTRTCSQCGGTMHYRLGDYECESCPYRESGKSTPPPADQLATPKHIPQVSAQTEASTLRSTQDYRKRNTEPDKYDPAPGLEREKLILLAIYWGRVLITVLLALLNRRDLVEAGVLTDTAGAVLVSVALIFPIAVLKTVLAYLTLIFGGLSLLAIMRSWILWVMLGGALALRGGFIGSMIFKDVSDSLFVALLLSLIAALLQLWLSSVLFRDVHRLQVIRAR